MKSLKKVYEDNEELFQEVIDEFVRNRKDPLRTHEVSSIVFNTELTYSQVLIIIDDLKAKFGKSVVTPGVRQALVSWSHNRSVN